MRRVTARGVVRRVGHLRRVILRNRALAQAEAAEERFAAGYRRWARRRSNKLIGALPDAWRPIGAPASPHPRIAVVVHAYYEDLVPELAQRISAVPVDCDVLITDATGGNVDPGMFAGPHVRNVKVYPVANHGRDIWPLVQLVNAQLLDPYELVLKLHTKRSQWRHDHPELAGDGEGWKDEFLTALVDDPDTIARNIAEFDARPGLGLLTAPGSILGPEFWGGDLEIASHLAKRLRMTIAPHRLRFASGSMYLIRGFVLQGLRALELTASDFEAEAGQIDGTTAHAIERLIGVFADEAGYLLEEVPAKGSDAPQKVTPAATTAIAFYLPQFHSFPENDEWWGKGFTEWSNVASAMPLFAGHAQPLLPADLGFYDLSDDRTLPRQVELARSHGIGAFMYYHYWFSGTTLMAEPLNRHVRDDIDFPFCLMWANENWTRRWDGGSTSILIEQEHHSVSPDLFIDAVMPYLKDPRYVTINGEPLLAVYKLSQLPDPQATVAAWRASAKAAGLPGLALISVDVGASMDGLSTEGAELVDGFMEFAPHNMPWAAHDISDLEIDPRFQGNIMDYRTMVEATLDARVAGVDDHRYPGVMVNFDNTSRRQWQSDLWLGTNPYTFRRWLRSTADAIADRPRDERVVFINAWNEWAESATLEPTQRYGKTYLLAARDALK